MDIHSDRIKLVALDLDGTLTQHKSKLDAGCRALLDALSRRYQLVMVCAGGCARVYNQMEGFPIDIIGNYGMELSTIDSGHLLVTQSHVVKPDKPDILARVEMLRGELGFTRYWGNSAEFHPSGAVTFPVLGTAAPLDQKLAFDPGREKRRGCYAKVKEVFWDYHVFIGGSSSFDIVPPPYCKLYALKNYLARHKIGCESTVYFGDDYATGGNDEDLYRSEIPFVCIDDYRQFPEAAKGLLLKEGD